MLTYRHLLVTSPDLVERLGMPATPDALRRFPCAAWASRVDVPPHWDLGGHPFEPRPLLSTNDYHHLRRRALDGDVVTELPPFLAAAAIRERRLVPLLPGHPLPEQGIHLPYPAHRHPSTIVRTYLDFCRDYLPHVVEACGIAGAG